MLLPAFLIGLLGSLHCLGMCGPIAFSIPKAGFHELTILAGKLLYNLGRIVTYAILGGILGIIGEGIVLAGFQQALSIGLGALLLLILFFPRAFQWNRLTTWQSKIKAKLIPQFKRSGLFYSFLIGFLNGFLPCGLVYVAIAGALATGDPVLGLSFMVLFGLGTVPMMLFAGYSQRLIPPSFKFQIQRVIPVFVAIMASVLILRGLNLGIPYLSPALVSETEITVCK